MAGFTFITAIVSNETKLHLQVLVNAYVALKFRRRLMKVCMVLHFYPRLVTTVSGKIID